MVAGKIYGQNSWESDASTNDTLILGEASSIGGHEIYNSSTAQWAVGSGYIDGFETIEAEDGNDQINSSSGTSGTITSNGTYTIDGKKYTVRDLTSGGSVDWSVEDGVITFTADAAHEARIAAASGQEDNVVIKGSSLGFNAGDMDDNILLYNSSGAYGGDGDDTITVMEGCTTEMIDGEAGNDSLVNNGMVIGSSDPFDGGEGNDTLINNGSVSNYIYGDAGDDSIVNNGVVAGEIYGQDYWGSDTSTNDKLIYGANSSVGGYGINDVQSAIDNNKIIGIETIEDEDGNDLLNPSTETSGTIKRKKRHEG